MEGKPTLPPALRAGVGGGAGLPRPMMADGTLEALKWLALVPMSADYVDKYLLDGTMPALFEACRPALPIFAFVLTCNPARPASSESWSKVRSPRR